MASYDFTISLFELGDCSMCLFSYICFPCAIAQARSSLDGSNFLMNCVSLKCVPARWLIRSTYHIPGDAINDCMVACFCPCCSANQLYQTTQLRGNPTPDGGSHHNLNEWKSQLGAGNARSCLYSTCCMPCAIGTMMETTMGMPWLLGCCCVDLWMARNLIRYQYRIKGNDLIEECAIPYGLQCIANALQQIIPCSMCILYAFFVTNSMQLLEETQKRAGETSNLNHTNRNRDYNNIGYTILGNDFNPSQGDYYLSSPSASPVVGQVIEERVESEIQMSPTVVRSPLGSISASGPAPSAPRMYVQPGEVVYVAPQHLQAMQQKTTY